LNDAWEIPAIGQGAIAYTQDPHGVFDEYYRGELFNRAVSAVSRRRKPFSSIAPFMFTMMPELNWFCVLTHFWLWQFIGVSFAIGWRRHLDRWCCVPSW